MKSVLSVAAGVAGVLFLVTVGIAADKPAAGAAAKPPASAAPATAAATGAPGTAAVLAPPKPGAEHTALKAMVGTWKCIGTWEASPMGPAKTTDGTMTIKPIWGGLYYEGSYKEKKTKENPYPMTGRATTGYDLNAKMYTQTWLSNWGEQMLSWSKGWEGDKMVWTADNPMGPGTKWVETVTKVSDKEHKSVFESTMGGKTSKVGELICKK